MQGHGRSGALSDYYQTVLQAGTGDSLHMNYHWSVVTLLWHSLSNHSLLWILVQGIIFVYDITNQPSFQHLAKWVSDVDEVRQ